MRKDITCYKCLGTGRLTDKSLPFEVGDRVVGIHREGKPIGTVILPRLQGNVKNDLGCGYHSNNVYAIRFDDGEYQHMGESALEFED